MRPPPLCFSLSKQHQKTFDRAEEMPPEASAGKALSPHPGSRRSYSVGAGASGAARFKVRQDRRSHAAAKARA